jgi:hypothetical protein
VPDDGATGVAGHSWSINLFRCPSHCALGFHAYWVLGKSRDVAEMPKIKKPEAPVLVNDEHLEGRYVELGPFTFGFERFHVAADPAPLFGGLPEDRCQCEHWGMVRSGKVVFRFADHDEEFTAGDFYYAPPGHMPLVTAGTEVAEFSPTAALVKTMEVPQANMAAEGAGQ